MRRSNRWSELMHRGRRDAFRTREDRAGPVDDLRRDESGSAALEFIAVGVLMLVPLVYLVVALGAIQGQALGVEAAARFAARAAVLDTSGDPRTAAEQAIRSVAAQYDIDAGDLDVAMTCRPATARCPAPGATVVITVRADVSLPLVPSVMGLDSIARVPVEATSAQKASEFWGAG